MFWDLNNTSDDEEDDAEYMDEEQPVPAALAVELAPLAEEVHEEAAAAAAEFMDEEQAVPAAALASALAEEAGEEAGEEEGAADADGVVGVEAEVESDSDEEVVEVEAELENDDVQVVASGYEHGWSEPGSLDHCAAAAAALQGDDPLPEIIDGHELHNMRGAGAPSDTSPTAAGSHSAQPDVADGLQLPTVREVDGLQLHMSNPKYKSSTGYYGVTHNGSGGALPFHAQVQRKDLNVYLGCFATAVEGAVAVAKCLRDGGLHPDAVWEVGDAVEARFGAMKNGTAWYRGRVRGVHELNNDAYDGPKHVYGPRRVYDIAYDDGDEELAVLSKHVRDVPDAVDAVPAVHEVDGVKLRLSDKSSSGYLHVIHNPTCVTKPYYAQVRRNGCQLLVCSFADVVEAATAVAEVLDHYERSDVDTAPAVREVDGVTLHLSEKSSTGYLGVNLCNPGGARPFQAQVQRKGLCAKLGTFATAVEGALAVAKHLHDAEAKSHQEPVTAAPASRQVDGVKLRLSDRSNTGYLNVCYSPNVNPVCPFHAVVQRDGDSLLRCFFATGVEAAKAVAMALDQYERRASTFRKVDGVKLRLSDRTATGYLNVCQNGPPGLPFSARVHRDGDALLERNFATDVEAAKAVAKVLEEYERSAGKRPAATSSGPSSASRAAPLQAPKRPHEDCESGLISNRPERERKKVDRLEVTHEPTFSRAANEGRGVAYEEVDGLRLRLSSSNVSGYVNVYQANSGMAGSRFFAQVSGPDKHTTYLGMHASAVEAAKVVARHEQKRGGDGGVKDEEHAKGDYGDEVDFEEVDGLRLRLSSRNKSGYMNVFSAAGSSTKYTANLGTFDTAVEAAKAVARHEQTQSTAPHTTGPQAPCTTASQATQQEVVHLRAQLAATMAKLATSTEALAAATSRAVDAEMQLKVAPVAASSAAPGSADPSAEVSAEVSAEASAEASGQRHAELIAALPPRAEAKAEGAEVRLMLTAFRLGQYAEVLVDIGYDDLRFLCDSADIEEVGRDVGMKKGHTSKLATMLASLAVSWK